MIIPHCRFVAGSLRGLLTRHAADKGAARPWNARLQLLCDVAEGMAQMHAKRYIHRDLKPDNVLVGSDGRAKIADLGLSRRDEAFNVEAIASLAQRRGQQLGRVDWTMAGGTPPCPSIQLLV